MAGDPWERYIHLPTTSEGHPLVLWSVLDFFRFDNEETEVEDPKLNSISLGSRKKKQFSMGTVLRHKQNALHLHKNEILSISARQTLKLHEN